MKGFTLVEFIVVVAIFLVLAATVVSFFFGGVGWYCARKWEGFDTKFDLVTGCRVDIKNNGRFIPEDHIRQY